MHIIVSSFPGANDFTIMLLRSCLGCQNSIVKFEGLDSNESWWVLFLLTSTHSIICNLVEQRLKAIFLDQLLELLLVELYLVYLPYAISFPFKLMNCPERRQSLEIVLLLIAAFALFIFLVWAWIHFTLKVYLDRNIKLFPAIQNSRNFVIWFNPPSILLQTVITIIAFGFLPNCVLAV